MTRILEENMKLAEPVHIQKSWNDKGDRLLTVRIIDSSTDYIYAEWKFNGGLAKKDADYVFRQHEMQPEQSCGKKNMGGAK